MKGFFVCSELQRSVRLVANIAYFHVTRVAEEIGPMLQFADSDSHSGIRTTMRHIKIRIHVAALAHISK